MTAIVTAARRRPDLIVLADDVVALDAPTVARLLRQQSPAMPILLLAGRTDVAAQIETLALVDLYLCPPWNTALIAASVRTLLGCSVPRSALSPAPATRLADALIEALVLELDGIQRLLLDEQRIQKTRRLRQAIGQLNHTKERIAALAGGEEL